MDLIVDLFLILSFIASCAIVVVSAVITFASFWFGLEEFKNDNYKAAFGCYIALILSSTLTLVTIKLTTLIGKGLGL